MKTLDNNKDKFKELKFSDEDFHANNLLNKINNINNRKSRRAKNKK